MIKTFNFHWKQKISVFRWIVLNSSDLWVISPCVRVIVTIILVSYYSTTRNLGSNWHHNLGHFRIQQYNKDHSNNCNHKYSPWRDNISRKFALKYQWRHLWNLCWSWHKLTDLGSSWNNQSKRESIRQYQGTDIGCLHKLWLLGTKWKREANILKMPP